MQKETSASFAFLSAFFLVLLLAGLALLVLMITTEGEPGALPLALTLSGGTGCFFLRRKKVRIKNQITKKTVS